MQNPNSGRGFQRKHHVHRAPEAGAGRPGWSSRCRSRRWRSARRCRPGPAARSRESSVVPMNSLSVSSSCSSSAGHPVSARICTTSATRPGSRTCRAARFTLISSRMVGVGGEPTGGLPARVDEDGAAKRDDQPGVLGERDEPVPAASRSPSGSCQRTSASTPIVRWSCSRTSGWYSTTNSPRGQRVGHPRGQREPADVAVVAFGVEQGVPVPAVGLGPVHGGVRGLHQRGGAVRGAVVGVLARCRRWRTRRSGGRR